MSDALRERVCEAEVALRKALEVLREVRCACWPHLIDGLFVGPPCRRDEAIRVIEGVLKS